MSFRFSDSFGMFDVTPVENLFMEEYMPRAPGDYVKVYLYGLRLCYHPGAQSGMDAFARALGLEQEVVRDAFTYWERQGVLRRVSDKPPLYQYNNLKAMLVRGASPEDENLYRLREFNTALQGIFGARLLAPAEYTRASEWIDDLKLSEDAVLMMVRSAVTDKGAKVSFNYLDKMAVTWAKQGLSTKEAVQLYLATRGTAYQGARKVVTAMGLKRSPTVAEERMYLKWMDDWGFTHEAVIEALGELTKIGNPNFAYLDKVLGTLRDKGATDAPSLEQERVQREADAAPVREILAALGAAGGVTDDLRAMYRGFLDKGFDPGAVLIAAKHARRRGGRSMQAVEETLARFEQRGLFSAEAIDAYMAEIGRERDAALTLKALSGDDEPLAQGDLQAYRRMMATGLSAEMLSLAAEYARGARTPLSFAAKVCDNWKQAGILTPQQARAEREGRGDKGAKKAANGRRKEVSAQQFDQREYSEGEWAALAMDIDELTVDAPSG